MIQRYNFKKQFGLLALFTLGLSVKHILADGPTGFEPLDYLDTRNTVLQDPLKREAFDKLDAAETSLKPRDKMFLHGLKNATSQEMALPKEADIEKLMKDISISRLIKNNTESVAYGLGAAILFPVAVGLGGRIVNAALDAILDIGSVASDGMIEKIMNWWTPPYKEEEKLGLVKPKTRAMLKKFTLDGYCISEEFRESLLDLLAILFGAKDFKKKGLKPILLYGPAGTGKTYLMNICANETKAKEVYEIELTKVISDKINFPDPVAFIERFFTQCKENKSFIIIDEAEAVVTDRGKLAEGGLDEYGKRQLAVVGALLKCLEDYGRYKYQGVVILATNFEGIIDDAIRSRFLPFHVPPSSKETLFDIMVNKELKTWNKLGAKFSINTELVKTSCVQLEAVEATGRDAEAIIMQTMLIAYGCKRLPAKFKREPNIDKIFKATVANRIKGQCLVSFNKKYAKENNNGKNILSRIWSVEQIAEVAIQFKKSLDEVNAEMMNKFKQDKEQNKLDLQSALADTKMHAQAYNALKGLSMKTGGELIRDIPDANYQFRGSVGA